MKANARIRSLTETAALRIATAANRHVLYMPFIEMACARGALASATRVIDPTDPNSWEFSAFSQNGEDGIIDYILAAVADRPGTFLEIGASDGLENNSSYLAFVKNFTGLMVDANASKIRRAEVLLSPLNWGVRFLGATVDPETAPELLKRLPTPEIDLLSLDIDGNDYYVARALLNAGLRPKLICVEYNSAFGPDRPVSIPYTPGFDYHLAHPSSLFYGVSIAGWRRFLTGYGYKFVTVDSRGVNGFFLESNLLADFFPEIRGMAFTENVVQLAEYPGGWREQNALIETLPVEYIA